MMPLVTLTGGKRVPFIWTQTVKPTNDHRVRTPRCPSCSRTHCSCSDSAA